MPQVVACTCGQRFLAKDELAGKRVSCPKCGSLIAIPAASDALPSAPAGDATLEDATAQYKSFRQKAIQTIQNLVALSKKVDRTDPRAFREFTDLCRRCFEVCTPSPRLCQANALDKTNRQTLEVLRRLTTATVEMFSRDAAIQFFDASHAFWQFTARVEMLRAALERLHPRPAGPREIEIILQRPVSEMWDGKDLSLVGVHGSGEVKELPLHVPQKRELMTNAVQTQLQAKGIPCRVSASELSSGAENELIIKIFSWPFLTVTGTECWALIEYQVRYRGAGKSVLQHSNWIGKGSGHRRITSEYTGPVRTALLNWAAEAIRDVSSAHVPATCKERILYCPHCGHPHLTNRSSARCLKCGNDAATGLPTHLAGRAEGKPASLGLGIGITVWGVVTTGIGCLAHRAPILFLLGAGFVAAGIATTIFAVNQNAVLRQVQRYQSQLSFPANRQKNKAAVSLDASKMP